MKPLARQLDLTATETGQDLLVHDAHLKETHRLNPLVALVYRHADGHTSVSELATLARTRLRRAVSKEMIISALDQLGDAGLLAPPPSEASRRAPIGAEASVG